MRSIPEEGYKSPHPDPKFSDNIFVTYNQGNRIDRLHAVGRDADSCHDFQHSQDNELLSVGDLQTKPRRSQVDIHESYETTDATEHLSN